MGRPRILHVDGVVGPSVLPETWISIDEDRIAAVDAVDPRGPETFDASGLTAVAGFIDIHCHGGAGHHFSEGVTEARTARRLHLEHGTTSLVASLVSASTSDLTGQIDTLGPLVDDGTFVGLHLEGPWINGRRRGAHEASALRDPDAGELAQLIDGAGGRISMVTLAPELPGAMDAIEYLTTRGIVAAIGHTDADGATAREAIDAGARVATHLFNAMPALGHRDPGPVGALLRDPRVIVELIADAVHVHPDVVSLALHAAGSKRVALVTDAMAAAGAGDGCFSLGGLEVIVADGVARTASDGVLAGSTLTLDTALRRSVLDAGWSVRDAVLALTATPARALALTDRGEISPGLRADIVLLDRELAVRGVLAGGAWVVEPR